jgi:hypothetical protein
MYAGRLEKFLLSLFRASSKSIALEQQRHHLALRNDEWAIGRQPSVAA